MLQIEVIIYGTHSMHLLSIDFWPFGQAAKGDRTTPVTQTHRHTHLHAYTVLTNAHSLTEVCGNIPIITEAFIDSFTVYTFCGHQLTGTV